MHAGAVVLVLLVAIAAVTTFPFFIVQHVTVAPDTLEGDECRQTPGSRNANYSNIFPFDPSRIAIQTINIIGKSNVVAFDNHKSYANKWGYTYISVRERTVARTHPAWQKIPATILILNDFDYVMWVDGDAFFMNCTISLEPLLHRMEHEQTSWLFSGDTNIVNSGQMIWKSNKITRQLLQDIDRLYYPKFRRYHTLFENGAIAAYLGGARQPDTADIDRGFNQVNRCWHDFQQLQNVSIPDPALTPFDEYPPFCKLVEAGDRSALEAVVDQSLLPHITFVSYRFINSYLRNYQPGDFIFHCAGFDKTICVDVFRDRFHVSPLSILC
jgi:hypothetical protein